LRQARESEAVRPSDPRLALVAQQAKVRPPHVYHCWHSIAENPRAFSPDAFALFSGLERRHVDSIMAVLAEMQLMPTKTRAQNEGRGTRLPAAMELPEEWLTFAQHTRRWLQGTVEIEFQTFLDYWNAQPGAKGVKLNWESTWRNWVRRSHTPDGSWSPNRSTAPFVPRIVTDEPKEVCTPDQARAILNEFGLARSPLANLAKSLGNSQ
jgi:hypothetical protein